MAQLPPDGRWLIQQIDDQVILFERYTEREITKFDPRNSEEIGSSLKTISENDELTEEQKSFSAFWAGYFYANARAVSPN